MPVCPCCERRVPYDDLRGHVKHCPDAHDGDEEALRTAEALDDRLTDVERRLLRRISRLEAELEVREMVSRTDEKGSQRVAKFSSQDSPPSEIGIIWCTVNSSSRLHRRHEPSRLMILSLVPGETFSS